LLVFGEHRGDLRHWTIPSLIVLSTLLGLGASTFTPLSRSLHRLWGAEGQIAPGLRADLLIIESGKNVYM